MSNEPILLFCHVPKCSGMTIILTFKHIYGDRHVFMDNGFEDPPDDATIVAGHFRAHKYDDIFPNAPKMTCLRDPVERLLSNFYFHKRSTFPLPRAWWVDEVRKGKMDVVEYAEHEANVLSHYVSREQIETFALIALTEKFDESMQFFFDTFNRGQRVLVDPYNKNIYRTTPMYEISPDARKKLEKIHEQDYETYRRGVELWPGPGIIER